jgi:hypothetical protein
VRPAEYGESEEMIVPESVPWAALESFYERRRDLLLRSNDDDECWQRMGIANRHLQRIEIGLLSLTPGVEQEINRCFAEVERWLRT